MYEYQATVVRVIDGDTLVLDVDLGFYVTVRLSCRLLGLNAAELADGGGPARDYMAGLCPPGTRVGVRSVKPDKYAGRFDGLVFTPNGVDVGAALIRLGLAKTWNGKGPKP